MTLTAHAMSTNTGISATKNFILVGYGNIIGYTVDQSGANIGSASVTLYNSNGTAKGSLAQVANNPLISASDGAYSFDKVPVGDYYIEAIKDNGTGYSVNTIGLGAQSINIRIEGYNVTPSVSPTATPSVEPTATETPSTVPTASPTVAPSATSGPANDQQATGIIAAGLALAVIIHVRHTCIRAICQEITSENSLFLIFHFYTNVKLISCGISTDERGILMDGAIFSSLLSEVRSKKAASAPHHELRYC